jgi:hypothetical protein
MVVLPKHLVDLSHEFAERQEPVFPWFYRNQARTGI